MVKYQIVPKLPGLHISLIWLLVLISKKMWLRLEEISVFNNKIIPFPSTVPVTEIAEIWESWANSFQFQLLLKHSDIDKHCLHNGPHWQNQLYHFTKSDLQGEWQRLNNSPKCLTNVQLQFSSKCTNMKIKHVHQGNPASPWLFIFSLEAGVRWPWELNALNSRKLNENWQNASK